jgi:isoleucyl-tRNA synthetase
VAELKLRQPLAKFSYNAPSKLSEELEKIMSEELNVKEVEYKKSSDNLTGEMDTNITPELQSEGDARELARQIQSLRKEQGLTLKDKVEVTTPNLPTDEKLIALIKQQTNALELISGDSLEIRVVND